MLLFTVVGSRVWLNVMMIDCVTETPIDPLGILLLRKVRPPLDAVPPVVNVLVKGTTALPLASVKPLTFTVYVIPADKDW